MTQNAGLDVLNEVTLMVKKSSETVRSRLISSLVEREIVNRVDLLDKSLLKLREAKKELDKVKADVETFDETGNKVSSSYSKTKYEERKKAQESKDKLEKAIEQALEGEGFDKLKELVAK